MVPRPGLSAAVVAVKLDHLIRRELDLLLLMSQFWSGSQIVIGYIRNETSGLMHMLLTAHLKFKRTTPVAFCPWRQRCHVTGAQKICRISEGMVRNFVGLLVQQAPIWCRNWITPDDLDICKPILDAHGCAVHIVVSDNTLEHPMSALMGYYASYYRMQKAVS